MKPHTFPTWTAEHHVYASADPAVLWDLFAEVPNWPTWNAGVEEILFEGPFATGTEFTMKPRGHRRLRFRLTDVQPPTRFTDETRVGDLTVTVTHAIEPVRSGFCRISFAVVAAGDGCDEVGPVVSADFPEVLAALAQLAESRVIA